MGWLFTQGQTRAALIRRLTEPQDNDSASYRTVAHCSKGNVLWAVQEVVFKIAKPHREIGTAYRFIGCYLMARQRDCGWGYKDMEESMHPYHYHCPLAYLDLAPEACPDWRKNVRAWHARASRPVSVGDIWSLVGSSVDVVFIRSVRPLRGVDRSGMLYRIPRRFLGEKLQADPGPRTSPSALSSSTQAVAA
jgi:hypothetical protein